MAAPLPKCKVFVVLLAGAAMLCGCGGNSTMTQPANANVRIVDGNGSMSSINVMVDGSALVNNVTFLTNTGYLSVPAGMHQLTLQGWSNPPNEMVPETFAENTKSTLLFLGWGPFGSEAMQIADDTTPPSSGNFKLRLVDGTFGGGFNALDVYILPNGTPPGGTPTIPGMTVSENSPSQYFSLAAGTYHVVFTDFQALTVEFDSGPLTFAAGQNRTFFLIQNCPGNSCTKSYTSMLLADLN